MRIDGRGWRRIGGATLALLLVALLALYLDRKPLAQGFIDRELARRGVPARYRVAGIGLRWERLENIRLGDPRDPDLTADWAEVRVSTGLSGVSVTAIHAGGVRLKGRLAGGILHFGSLDKLLPASTGGPFRLPDLDVDLSDARMKLDTPWGQAGARLDGAGNLSGGFKGRLAAIMPRVAAGGCTGTRATAFVQLSIVNRAPRLAGPARADGVDCVDARVRGAAAAVDVGLAEALDRWRGGASLKVERIDTGGASLGGIGGRIDFAGSRADTRGTLRLTARDGLYGANRANDLAADGRWRVTRAFGWDGTARAARVTADPAYADALARTAASLGATPLGPVIRRLAESMRQAGRAFAFSADMATPEGGTVAISRLIARSQSGAALSLTDGQGVRLGSAGWSADGTARLSGGGLPEAIATFARNANGAGQGVVRVAPYAADGARVALDPVRIAFAPGAVRAETRATIDGPLGDGRVAGLTAPLRLIARDGAVALNPGCTTVGFRALAVSGLTLNPAAIGLCADGAALIGIGNGRISGGARLGATRLSGRIGGTPLALSATGGRVSLGDSGFAVTGLAAVLGDADRRSHLALGALAGRFGQGGLTGSFTALSGDISKVPLLLSDARGAWALRGGVLTADASALTVADAGKRFNPLAGEGVRLRLADGQVTMKGRLLEPRSRVSVADVTLLHDLRRGAGRANLAVAGLEFGKTLQPEALTPLTIGVIANLQGTVTGAGDIAWEANGVTSTGRFATTGLDFAAAFGPVTGLRGTIEFSDLLALVTPPGQVVMIDQVNPGTLVKDGRIAYHLSAGQVIAIEGGRWPFAGGELLLDPANVEMAERRPRRLTFRIKGLDAAKFIAQLEFEDLAATGIFDGALPMVFDETGGRIEGGHLAARGGGTLSYVGEVSNAALNAYAKLAFDALKSIRYRDLTIDLDGALDGEMVSRIVFTGVSQGPGTKSNFIVRRLAKLPFKFNITIRAPFRGLLTTARGLQDPSTFLRAFPVQPPESEPRP